VALLTCCKEIQNANIRQFIDQLLEGFDSPADILGEAGLLKQLNGFDDRGTAHLKTTERQPTLRFHS
jgi:hypothetical protein